MRASQPALLAAGRVIAELRDQMVVQWADWLGDRIIIRPHDTASSRRAGVPHPARRHQRNGRVRCAARSARCWLRACEHYGRVAAARGLAAGEVVEELQFLRELLIRNLAPVLAAMRARQGMAIMLRLNRVIDKGIAVAVVGYTDALVATLFAQNGVPSFVTEYDVADVERQLDAIEQQLATPDQAAAALASLDPMAPADLLPALPWLAPFAGLVRLARRPTPI